MVKDAIPLVEKGGADVEVRINRGIEADDLDAVVFPGPSGIMIPKCASPEDEVALARRVKASLDEAYARGEGSVSVDGRMYDVANMKHVNYLLARAEAIKKCESEKAAALASAGNHT
jgi:citrate lyase beta subunit